jgi:hypothetical protein
MGKVCGASGTELARGTGGTRSVEANRDHILKTNARFFGSDLETVCDLLEALFGPLLCKRGIFKQALDEKLLLLVQQRVVDRSSA